MKKFTILLPLMLLASLAFGQTKDTAATKEQKTDTVTKAETTSVEKKDTVAKATPTPSVPEDSVKQTTKAAPADSSKQTAKSDSVKTAPIDTLKQAAKTDTSKKAAVIAPLKTDSVKKGPTTPLTKVDSLNLANAKLSEQLDSLSKDLARYQILYTAIKVKVVKHDFDPIRMSDIIDSVAARKDSTFTGLNSSAAYLRDSISVLNKEILRLNEKYGENAPADATKARLAKELKQLKELLDMKVLTQSEFDIKKTMILQKWQ